MDIQEIRRLAGVKDTRDLNETRLKLNQARQEANIENGEGEHLQSWIASLSKEPKFLKDAKVEYEIAVFSTTARQKDSDKPFQSFGTLKIGNVGVGIEGPALKVFYEPQKSTINSADKPVEVDISASTRCTSIHPRRYQKHNDSQYTWSFDITSTNYETEDAEFTGTLTTADDVIYEWTGSRIATEDRFDQQQQIELEKPENLDGEFTELKMLSPFTSSIQTSQDGTQETVSKDMARIEGNKIMQKLMANALDDKTKKNLVPDLLPLRKEEEKILHENRDFLRLAGIHDLAEGIKAVPEFDKEIRARIQPKFVKFLEMLMHDEEGADQTHDPAADYGWDRKTRAKEIKKLRGQYLNVVSSTYTEGYKALRPQWNRFLKQPKYWFTVLSEHIMKDDTMERFRVAATSTTTDASYESKIQVQVWTQNLMMLKTCAAEKGVELDMEPVYAQLKSNSVLALTEAQIWNDDMKERLAKFEKFRATADTEKLREKMKNRSEAFHEAFETVCSDIKLSVVELHLLFATRAEVYWNLRNPFAAKSNLTVGQLIRFSEVENFEMELHPSTPSVAPPSNTSLEQTTALKKWGQKAKKLGKNCATLFFHCAAIINLVMMGSSHSDAIEKGCDIAFATAEAISLSAKVVPWVGRKILQYWAQGRVFMQSIHSFSKNLATGNIVKRSIGAALGRVSVAGVVATFCFIGCVLEAVHAFSDMKEAMKAQTPGHEYFRVYAQFRFVMSVLHVVTTGVLITASVFKVAALASFCGPIALGLVIISLGVGLAFEVFSPKAVDPIIDFLETELKDCNGFPDKAESSSNGIQISPRIAGSDSPSTAQIWEEEPTAAEQMDAWVVLLIGKDDGIMHHSWM